MQVKAVEGDSSTAASPVAPPRRRRRRSVALAARRLQCAGAEPREERERRGRLDQFIPDIVRRTFYARARRGVHARQKRIRKLASDFICRRTSPTISSSRRPSKDELFRVVGKELHNFLETVNVSGQLQKLLTSLSFEIKTEIRFIPNDEAVGGVKPDLKIGRMSVKRQKREPGAHAVEDNQKKSGCSALIDEDASSLALS